MLNDMDRLAKLLDKIDNNLINKSAARLNAIKKTTKAVSKLSEALEEVNKGLQQNLDLEREQRRMETFNLFEWVKSIKRSDEPIKTEEFVETVKKESAAAAETTNTNTTAATTKAKTTTSTTANIDTNQLTAAIVNAINAGLNQWIDRKKPIFVELDGKHLKGNQGLNK
jgi:predicted extracellular nuclease